VLDPSITIKIFTGYNEHMKTFIDNLLGRVTMYRLMLYYLGALLFGAIGCSMAGLIPYAACDIAGTAVLLCVFSYIFNWFFATLFRARQNPESQFITAFILALIMRPVSVVSGGVLILFVAAFVAMGAKYLLAYKKMHVFNPAAVGTLAAALIFGYGSSWWVGSVYMAPVIIIGGLLVAYKIQRLGMVAAFMGVFIASVALVMGAAWRSFDVALNTLAHPWMFAPALFFAFVMLVEPLTSPQKRNVQYYYAALVGVLAVAYGYFDGTAPHVFELALLSGNVFNRAFYFDPRVVLTLRKREDVANNTTSFWFEPSHPISFVPGQFMEWELPHRHPDDRGVRRFFTICSSPTEQRVMLATKFSEPSSTFKTTLRAMKEQDKIVAMHVAGEFTLPNDDGTTPCVFIAGGIGVTPFRSMVQYMLDKKLSRPITLLYSNKTASDIAFKPIFDEAALTGWLKPVYTVIETAPYGWKGRVGYITADMIKEEVPEYMNNLFYVSGPQPMVAAFQKMLGDMGVPSDRIKTDFFPGYAETHQQA